jgi:hypothetical protein
VAEENFEIVSFLISYKYLKSTTETVCFDFVAREVDGRGARTTVVRRALSALVSTRRFKLRMACVVMVGVIFLLTAVLKANAL